MSIPRLCIGLCALLLTTVVESQAEKAREKKERFASLPGHVKRLLLKAKEIELYSFEPTPTAEERTANKDKIYKGSYLILGKVVVDAKTQRLLVDTLEKAAGKGEQAKCFMPRHAIRAAVEGKTLDLVICFACGQFYITIDGKEVHESTITIDQRAQPVFDDVLKKANIPLARKME